MRVRRLTRRRACRLYLFEHLLYVYRRLLAPSVRVPKFEPVVYVSGKLGPRIVHAQRENASTSFITRLVALAIKNSSF